MTTPSTPRKAGPYTGNGTTTSWPFSFKVFAASDIAVTVADTVGTESTLVLDSDYTVTLNANQDTSPGGTVTYSLPSSYILTITGDLDYDQTYDIPAGGNFNPAALENALDRITMQVQQLREIVSRAMQIPVSSSASGYLPVPDPSALIGWDSDGESLANFPLENIATALAFATFRPDTFTGDGVTDTFLLTSDPVIIGNIDVSVDGMTYVPNVDFTLSSQNLVFTDPPADGAQILARYGQALPPGTTADADAVSFQPAGSGAVTTTVQEKLREVVSVKDFGAVGDGTTDDTGSITAAISAATLANRTLYFPAADYKVTSSLTVTCSTYMENGGYLSPSGLAANAVVFNVTARTTHENIRIQGNQAYDPANGTIGIRPTGLNASRSTFVNCSVVNLKYGAVCNTFSVLWLNCRFNYNTTNFSTYASSAAVQINDVHIFGGNYSNPLGTYAVKVGDSSFSTTVPVGQPHGVGFSINGTALDGGTLRIESFTGANIGTAAPVYFESPVSGTCIELASDPAQDGYVNNVTIGANFYNTAQYAVYCFAGVDKLVVLPSTYTLISKCALYVRTDIYPFTYYRGKSTSCFTLAPEVHTGRRHGTYTSFSFANVSLPDQGVISGRQEVVAEPNEQYASAIWLDGLRNATRRSSSSQYGTGRRYKTPTTAKAGTLTSYLFTFTAAADAKFFNGGDEYDAGALGGGVIDRVDYEAGVAYLSDSSAAGTAGTLSQTTAAWRSETATTSGSAPASGTWAKGDHCRNANSTVGSPKGWYCTAAGTPGTWVSEGNL